MYGERHDELVREIGGLLYDMLPEGADRIVADGDVGEASSNVAVEWFFPNGKSGWFDTVPPEISDLSQALIELRKNMIANGSEPWYGYVFTVRENGDFDMNLSYDEPSDEFDF